MERSGLNDLREGQKVRYDIENDRKTGKTKAVKLRSEKSLAATRGRRKEVRVIHAGDRQNLGYGVECLLPRCAAFRATVDSETRAMLELSGRN